MTRINIGIPPAYLSDKHLIAEHRELVRIPNNIAKGRCNLNDIPKRFKLGEGHVRFFYNKLEYLRLRYDQLYYECRNRGINVVYFGGSFTQPEIPKRLFNNWLPCVQDIFVLYGRLMEKDPKRYTYRYFTEILKQNRDYYKTKRGTVFVFQKQN